MSSLSSRLTPPTRSERFSRSASQRAASLVAPRGDITQTDLPKSIISGLREAIDVLSGVEGIAFVHFDERDVVRHPLVQKIVAAYDRHSRQGVVQP